MTDTQITLAITEATRYTDPVFYEAFAPNEED